MYSRMDASKQLQGLNVGKESFLEVLSNTFPLLFVKLVSRPKILNHRAKDDNLHALWSRRSLLASLRGMNSSVPSARSLSLSSITSRCHSGDSRLSSSRDRSAQSFSMARSFSSRVSLLRSKMVFMATTSNTSLSSSLGESGQRKKEDGFGAGCRGVWCHLRTSETLKKSEGHGAVRSNLLGVNGWTMAMRTACSWQRSAGAVPYTESPRMGCPRWAK